ncbi:MAG: hypothetical protein ABJ000_10715 [Saccharospirillum sp.]|uniref:hypothetical protein n=1 Tax=Saccharospirillum sp. TaxID=2033801 RepID=UPI003299AB04
MKRLVPLLILSLALFGCNSSSNSSGNTPQDSFEPEIVALERVKLLDVTGQPLTNVVFSIESGTLERSNATAPSGFFTTDGAGQATVPGMSAGNYDLSIDIEGAEAALKMNVGVQNTSSVVTIAMPVLLGADNTLTSVEGKGFFASFNGIIYDRTGPVEGAQIELSAGAASNGAIATAISDEDGHYSLIVNVGSAIMPSLNNAVWRVTHDDFSPLVITNLDVLGTGAVTGFNHGLVQGNASANVLYRETFSQTASSATCGAWTSDAVNGGALNLWHNHAANQGLRNQALDDNLVKLAPDDQSLGAIPNPGSNRACWYGQPGNAPATGQGNFIGTAEETGGGVTLDGGTSDEPNAGAIVSPRIDLTSASGPLSVTFRNWWEIESVNPNNEGFDLMSVQISTDNGDTWTTLARLNPLSDPIGQADRAPLPYSNRGYNKAPAWLWQEPIDISEFAGEQIRLRLEFDTVDELYNGFRGWLVDEIRIINQAGTFPRWTDGDEGDLQLSDVSPVADLPLVGGESYSFRVNVAFTGDADNVQLQMSYISWEDMLNAQQPTLLAELEPGITSGTLISELMAIEDDLFFILIEAVDDQGVELTSESIPYSAI